MHSTRCLGRHLRRLGGLLALPVLLLATASADPASSADPLATMRVQSFQVPIPAPTLSLEGVDGHPLRLESLRGRMVLLNFWATWCVPCRQEMPAFQRLHREYQGRGLAVVAVNFRESAAEVQGFFKDLSLSFLSALDPAGSASTAYGVRGLPVTFLVSRDGRILWKAIGSREWEGPEGRAYFEKILQSPEP